MTIKSRFYTQAGKTEESELVKSIRADLKGLLESADKLANERRGF